jgi:hypothetical protein
MIRFVFRFFGMLLLAGGFAALLYDGTRTIAANTLTMTPLSFTWNNIHSNSLQSLQSVVEKSVPLLWDPVLRTVVAAPTWSVLAVLGLLLMLIGRKKKPVIGYARS